MAGIRLKVKAETYRLYGDDLPGHSFPGAPTEISDGGLHADGSALICSLRQPDLYGDALKISAISGENRQTIAKSRALAVYYNAPPGSAILICGFFCVQRLHFQKLTVLWLQTHGKENILPVAVRLCDRCDVLAVFAAFPDALHHPLIAGGVGAQGVQLTEHLADYGQALCKGREGRVYKEQDRRRKHEGCRQGPGPSKPNHIAALFMRRSLCGLYKLLVDIGNALEQADTVNLLH